MPPLSKEKLARLRELERELHVRAFGEEMARVNLDFTMEERLNYLGWMRELARKNGVPEAKRFPYDRDYSLDDADGKDAEHQT
jgi:hypothetical protein